MYLEYLTHFKYNIEFFYINTYHAPFSNIENIMISFLAILIIAYLLGSISPSILISRWIKGVDIRTYGSGNAGMTNAIRLLGGRWGAVVAIIDILKGLISSLWLTDALYSAFDATPLEITLVRILAAIAAVAGHIWTIFFGFKGGKGVLTMAGAVLGVAPLPVGICFATFILIFALTRYVSLGSIIGSWVFPIVVFIQRFVLQLPVSDYLLGFSLFVMALITFTHRENIRRLMRGEEKKFGAAKSTVPNQAV